MTGLSDEARATAGLILLTSVAVQLGGLFVLRVTTKRREMTPLQQTF